MTLIDPRVVMHPEVCLYELCRGHTTAVAYIHTYIHTHRAAQEKVELVHVALNACLIVVLSAYILLR